MQPAGAETETVPEPPAASNVAEYDPRVNTHGTVGSGFGAGAGGGVGVGTGVGAGGGGGGAGGGSAA